MIKEVYILSSRKTTTKQERFELVSRFLQSGQSHTVWCQENGIKPTTFYRWRMEYKTVQHDVCFVPLQFKASKRVHLTPKEEMINSVLIELGPCKVHVPEHVAVSLLRAVFKEAVDHHV